MVPFWPGFSVLSVRMHLSETGDNLRSVNACAKCRFASGSLHPLSAQRISPGLARPRYLPPERPRTAANPGEPAAKATRGGKILPPAARKPRTPATSRPRRRERRGRRAGRDLRARNATCGGKSPESRSRRPAAICESASRHSRRPVAICESAFRHSRRLVAICESASRPRPSRTKCRMPRPRDGHRVKSSGSRGCGHEDFCREPKKRRTGSRRGNDRISASALRFFRPALRPRRFLPRRKVKPGYFFDGRTLSARS